MKIIVGLGNPGQEYKDTRHNIGFMTIDALAEKLDIVVEKSKFKGILGEGIYNQGKIVLVKPLTYMNLSGETVGQVINWYKTDLTNLLVVYDDMSLPLGQLRFRAKGSSGGHNGIKSITSHLNTENFARLKVGIGSPNNQSVTGHVLGKFSKVDQPIIQKTIETAAEAVKIFLAKGILDAMNQYN